MHPLIVFVLLAAVCNAETSAQTLNCSMYEDEFLPVIEMDLLPWSSGIDARLLEETVKFAFNGSSNGDTIGACSSVHITIQNGNVMAQYPQPTCNTTAAWPLVSAFENFFRKVGRHLPDAHFVISTGDKTVNHEYHARWNTTRYPVFHFCRSSDTDDILVESHMVHMSGSAGLSTLRRQYEERPPPPWEMKKDVMFAAWTNFRRWTFDANDPATLRYGEEGEINYDSRKEVEIVARKMNDSRVQINTNGFVPPWNWSQYKYIVHVDGITCSNKIFESLLSGSLIIVEQSGFVCLPQAHLRPFEHYVPFYTHFPQDLQWVWTWIQKNPQRAKQIAENGHRWAKTFLSKDALTCRWQLLLDKYNSLFKQAN